ncbi:two component transcriptional regulator [Campylobacter lari]|uniref:hypothetical protein n=1 Tax=Campylobacter TaxID=194 RepID=UPI000DF10C5B|nr:MULTISPECIES: hypothetical protein [Campylobacter]MCR8712221.1 hypothetical protein [Campylobacter sp. W0066.1]EAJ6151353.1 hypothetical protein [Campylobacter lari]MCV3552182.1 hypothetical protein [Campylobacter sp. CNRCH_2013_0855]STA76093.1 two component transcriptional regulator [Campylobacter lari]VEJ08120.1 two component transcriptional regulator [Campylobacter lari]
MNTHFIIATRQLTGYSGSDLYINLSSIDTIEKLFSKVSNSTAFTINDKKTSYDSRNRIAYFEIFDPILEKYFQVHIKDNRHRDGLWFRLTNYIKYQKITPGQFLVLSLNINKCNAEISIYSLEFYRYILQKHEKYYVLMSEINSNENYDIVAENYLANFNILRTDTFINKWHGSFITYKADSYSKKYIGIPYDINLKCDEFNEIGDII